MSQVDRRAQLVEAAVACIRRFGLAKTTLEDVAAEAGVSRQTVYRYVADRQELLVDALLAELDRATLDLPFEGDPRHADTPDEVAALFVENMVHTIEGIRESPLLSSLLAAEGDSVRATLSGASAALFAYNERELRPWLELAQSRGLVRADLNVAEACEWMLRIVLSLITEEGPVERDADALRRYLMTYLVPALLP